MLDNIGVVYQLGSCGIVTGRSPGRLRRWPLEGDQTLISRKPNGAEPIIYSLTHPVLEISYHSS